MSKRILVLGSTGQLGHQVVWRLEQNPAFEVHDLAYRTNLRESTILHDVTDINGLLGIIDDLKPNVIVNCIGVLVSDSQKSPKRAILLNSLMPHELASKSNEIGAKLIHISTDCVFSGKKGQYGIDDVKDGYDTYAKTKALGEIEGHPTHCTLRTSIVGPELKENGTGLFHWFMGATGEISGYKKAIWSGVTTYQLAKTIEEAITKDISGLHQVTNGIPINKFDLLSTFASETKKAIAVNSTEGKSVDKSLVAGDSKWYSTIPSYAEMIREMVVAIKGRREEYPTRYQDVA